MANKFKNNKTGAETNSIFKGNWAIDTTASNIGGGPSSVTELYHGADIPPGGYVMYSPEGAYIATTDSDLLLKVKDLGGDWSSVSAAITWAATDPTIIILNKAFDNIVTDGLVLNLDASNISSFNDSEPTVNYVPGSYAYGMYAYASGPVGATAQDQNGQVVPVNRYTIYQASNTARAAIYPDTNTTDYHTFSFKWKYNGTTTASPIMSISAAKGNPEGAGNNNSFEYQTGDTISIGNNWYLSTYTFKFSSNPTGRCVLTFGISTGSNQSYLGETFDIYEAQFELKDHATPFVDGTRSQNTVLRGLSANNHTVLLNNEVSYIGNYLSFDGIDDYGAFSSESKFTSGDGYDFTFEVWFKMRTLPTAAYGPNGHIWGGENGNDLVLYLIPDDGTGSRGNMVFDDARYTESHYTNHKFQADTWAHWVICGDGTNNTLTHYVNGSLDRENSPVQSSQINRSWGGSRLAYDARWGTYSTLDLGIARQYNKMLSLEEVTQNFNAQRNIFGI